MAGFTRTVHPVSTFAWGKLRDLVPDMNFNLPAGEEPMALALVDPDQEQHVFIFSEDGREKLIKALTGGIVLSNGHMPIL